jgi:hypothetical protein
MTKRKQVRFDDAPDIFEQFGDTVKHGIGALLKFGVPALADHGDISAGEFVIDPRIERWLDAFHAADGGDKSALVRLLKSGHPIPDVIGPHIGDLIERWDLVPPAHRMRTPSYRLTDDDIEMIAACSDVDDLVSAGKPLSAALDKIAARRGLPISKLREFHSKRRGPDRRVKARAYKRGRAGK